MRCDCLVPKLCGFSWKECVTHMRKTKETTIKVSVRPQTPEEEERFRVMLDSVIRQIAVQTIKNMRDEHAREKPEQPDKAELQAAPDRSPVDCVESMQFQDDAGEIRSIGPVVMRGSTEGIA